MTGVNCPPLDRRRSSSSSSSCSCSCCSGGWLLSLARHGCNPSLHAVTIRDGITFLKRGKQWITISDNENDQDVVKLRL